MSQRDRAKALEAAALAKSRLNRGNLWLENATRAGEVGSGRGRRTGRPRSSASEAARRGHRAQSLGAHSTNLLKRPREGARDQDRKAATVRTLGSERRRGERARSRERRVTDNKACLICAASCTQASVALERRA
eukprot:6191601-Pleurochrysis_carterae.AAC.2